MLVPRLLSFGTLFRSSSMANLPAGTRTKANQLTKMTIGRLTLIALPNAKVSDRSQPPLMSDLSLSEPAGSGSLHRPGWATALRTARVDLAAGLRRLFLVRHPAERKMKMA